MELQDFFEGKAFDAYEYFGAHITNQGVIFRVYAPNADGVKLIGDFNNWHGETMSGSDNGIYSFCSQTAKKGMLYKYRILQKNGREVEKSDPYGFGMELRPNSASVITDLSEFKYTDDVFIKNREKGYNRPINIYEVHLGSFKENRNNPNGWYSYREMAKILIPYVKKSGYTHIEFLPLSEHPADCSWGYQVTGFFSPTSRYGTAKELMYLVNECHKAGIGVIMDFVPVHFAIDGYALTMFDGSPLYEYPFEDVGNSQWGTFNFMYSKGEVRSFLQSAANYWIQKFHFDGIRMDAISNALYWQGDPSRGVNTCAVNFIRTMNQGLHEMNPGIMLIAEDSTSYLKVTAPVQYDGLGFDYKWDMGWMNDTLDYMRTPPEERPAHYHKLTFSMHYFYNELFLLPFSHDEVVHGKATIMQKMWGDYEDKFKQCRLLYLYMYAHPGKKLNFMGNEIGQFREWDESREQDWELCRYPAHDSFYKYIVKLNHLYCSNKALYDGEYDSRNFEWIKADAPEQSVYIFSRGMGHNKLIVALNFSDNHYKEFLFDVKEELELREVINSDSEIYGGNTKRKKKVSKAVRNDKTGGYTLKIELKEFSGKIFEVVERENHF